MDPVIIVSGKWIMKKRYVFNVDSRGCRVLHLGEKTKLEDFTNLKKSEQLRLCVEITEKKDDSSDVEASEEEASEEEASEEDASEEEALEEEALEVESIENGSYDGCSLEDEQDEIENDCFSNVEIHDVAGEDEIGKENEEDDEFESRFDMFDDSDGASSEDDNFSTYGESPIEEDEDSPTLPSKKRYQNFLMSESKGNLEVLKLEMSSLDLALYKNFLGDVGPAVCPESVGIAITKQFGVKVIMLQRLSYVRV
ncbi:unnamed protein product [Brassica rapa subsp. narinosa]